MIDTIFLVPIVALSFWTLSMTRTGAMLLEFPVGLAFTLYNIYFVGRWGQTLGKMAMKIRVVSLDGHDAGFKRALYRHAVDLVFAVSTCMLTIFALLSITEHAYNQLGLPERLAALNEKTGVYADAVVWMSFAWMASELIVLLFNRKRRAIHDYIAGTVVIHVSEAAVAV